MTEDASFLGMASFGNRKNCIFNKESIAMTKKYFKIGLGLLGVFVIIFILNTLNAAGSFTTLTSHIDGQIETTYTNTPGAEDMDIDYQKGLLFISSTDRWQQFQNKDV
ncbi:MAG: hypothetical protein HOP30_22430 [Cyclobacteriaceae bacterium]|nr:hypothetical protein [Cyclobacteriaceae bacterium]